MGEERTVGVEGGSMGFTPAAVFAAKYSAV